MYPEVLEVWPSASIQYSGIYSYISNEVTFTKHMFPQWETFLMLRWTVWLADARNDCWIYRQTDVSAQLGLKGFFRAEWAEEEALRHYVLGSSRARARGPVRVEQTLLQRLFCGCKDRTFHKWPKTLPENLNQIHCVRFRYAWNVNC